MRLRNRSASEVERLYRDYEPALLLFARSICGEHGRAQDAVHQVFLKIMDRADLRTIGNLKAYLFASVRNELLNESKTVQRMVTLDDDLWFEPPHRDFVAEANLRSALAGLPDEQRQVVVLHVWGELAFAEIAEVLGMNANTVASRYRYALAKLREAMSAKELPGGTQR